MKHTCKELDPISREHCNRAPDEVNERKIKIKQRAEEEEERRARPAITKSNATGWRLHRAPGNQRHVTHKVTRYRYRMTITSRIQPRAQCMRTGRNLISRVFCYMVLEFICMKQHLRVCLVCLNPQFTRICTFAGRRCMGTSNGTVGIGYAVCCSPDHPLTSTRLTTQSFLPTSHDASPQFRSSL